MDHRRMGEQAAQRARIRCQAHLRPVLEMQTLSQESEDARVRR